MTLTVKLDLSSEQESQLKDSITRHDSERIRRLLSEALESTIETLLENGLETLDEATFDATIDQLTDLVAEAVTPDTPVLSDDAVSRAGIYEDHP